MVLWFISKGRLGGSGAFLLDFSKKMFIIYLFLLVAMVRPADINSKRPKEIKWLTMKVYWFSART